MAVTNTRRTHYPNDKSYLDNGVMKNSETSVHIAIFYVFIFILKQ